MKTSLVSRDQEAGKELGGTRVVGEAGHASLFPEGGDPRSREPLPRKCGIRHWS